MLKYVCIKHRCEVFYPASRSIAAAQVDFREFANMNGTVNVTTPFEKFKYLGAHFTTETSGWVYVTFREDCNILPFTFYFVYYRSILNRYIELFWPNNMAYLNSKCTITTGTSALERDTVGVLLVEVPLTTRHFGRVDYSYSVSALHI